MSLSISQGVSALRLAALASLLTLSRPGRAESAPPTEGGLVSVLSEEVDRLWSALRAQPEPAYWLAVDVVDRRSIDIQATHGGASPVSESRVRLADLDLRVGSPQLDQTHKIRDAGWFSEEQRPEIDLPFVNTPDRALRFSLWRAADDAYRSAVRRLTRVRNNDAVKVAREDRSADFSSAPTIVDLRDGPTLVLDKQRWKDVVRQASALFLEYPDVFDSNVSLSAVEETETFVSSEGTRLRYGHVRARLAAWGGTVAPDGMELQVYDYIEVADVSRLPDPAAVEAMVRGVASRVEALRKAPLVEPFVGPAILRGRAAAVFFHEILGHRLEGHRQKDEDEGQTLTDKVGQRIFPTFIQVTDDPTASEWHGMDLSGHYPYDNEGVAAEPVRVVENGVLKGFLMSRSPIEGFDRSNGHGRRQSGAAVVARQGNLIVTATETMPYEALHRRLLDEVKKQGKPFGLIFEDISGGFTFTGRATPNAFQVTPVVVWRVYADGRPDELIRGADLIGTPLVAFDRIIASSDQTDVFNGVCGAESGWVPVSAAAPDLLLREVEVQRKEKENDRPPLLPPPGVRSPGGPS